VRTKVLEHATTSPQLLNKLSFCLDTHSTSCLFLSFDSSRQQIAVDTNEAAPLTVISLRTTFVM
jgi:hypothetical protein